MVRVVEGDRERTQAFEGVVIRRRRGGINSNFTVRRVTHGVGVERTFPLYSPRLENVEVVRVGRVRRARLYYLRDLTGRKARIRAGSRDRLQELTRQSAEFGEPEEEEAPGAADELDAAAGEGEGVEAAAVAEVEEEAVSEVEEAAEEPATEDVPDATAEEAGESEAEPEGPSGEGEPEPDEAEEPKP